MGNANGTSPLDNMRNLEHYLNDIMRGAGDASDHHLKGKYFFLFHLLQTVSILWVQVSVISNQDAN